MALKLYERYPQRWDSPSNDYPQGAFKNLTELGEQDGSYLEQDWLNDRSGFFGALLRNAEMTPNGLVDTAQQSQFYDALVAVTKKAVGEEGYRKLDDNVFNGLMTIESDGTVRGQIVATDQGLQLTQYPKDGELQTFTFPSDSGEMITDHMLLESTPIGTVQAYIGENAPNDKWLLCRGQAFSAEGYPDLAQLLPDLKIPDLRGVALRGLDANRGFDPNRELLSYQEDAMQKIIGAISPNVNPADSSSYWLGVAGWGGAFKNRSTGNSSEITGVGVSSGPTGIDFDSSRTTRTNAQNETVMKNIAVNFIIKAR